MKQWHEFLKMSQNDSKKSWNNDMAAGRLKCALGFQRSIQKGDYNGQRLPKHAVRPSGLHHCRCSSWPQIWSCFGAFFGQSVQKDAQRSIFPLRVCMTAIGAPGLNSGAVLKHLLSGASRKMRRSRFPTVGLHCWRWSYPIVTGAWPRMAGIDFVSMFSMRWLGLHCCWLKHPRTLFA